MICGLSSLAIAEWFAPLRLSEFRASHLGQRVFSGTIPGKVLAPLAQALGDRTPLELLEKHQGDVTAWFQDQSGRLRLPKVSPAAAKDLFRAGTTIYMRGLSELGEISSQFASTFGLPPHMVQTGIFCNVADAVTRTHFDRVDTFCIQLRGSKTWSVANNDVVPSSLTTWATLEPVPQELQLQAQGALPNEMPMGDDVHLSPGSLLYVPRGVWHRTRSTEPACSLHIHVEPIAWLDVMLDALRARLLGHPEWRASAYAISDHDQSTVIAEKVTSLLRELTSITQSIAVDDVLIAPSESSKTAIYSRTAGATFEVLDTIDDIARIRVNKRRLPWSPTAILEVPVELLPACWWVQSQNQSNVFTASDVAAVFGLELDLVEDLFVGLATTERGDASPQVSRNA
jgi:50S ribosomal protein L16 3-hydroxylase